MGVVLTDDVADDTRGLLIGAIPVIVQFVHREENATVHRFETVPDIRERAANDHAHRVIEVAAAHFFFQRNWKSFLGEGIHKVSDN